jgi:DEAD/DEAH box helicase/Helicase conserved C-terminal domain
VFRCGPPLRYGAPDCDRRDVPATREGTGGGIFAVGDIAQILGDERFIDDLSLVRATAARLRVGQASIFDHEATKRLAGFVELVTASAPSWVGDDGLEVAATAGEIAHLLSLLPDLQIDHERYRLRAALLYEPADLPMMAGAIYGSGNGAPVLRSLFKRQGPFRSLADPLDELLPTAPHGTMALDHPLTYALSEEAYGLARYEHGGAESGVASHEEPLSLLASILSLDLRTTDVNAFEAAIKRRAASATRANVPSNLLPDLTAMAFPPELLAAQVRALRSGLLDLSFDAWSFAAPTGTGKTFLTRLLILNNLRVSPGRKALYIVPSKALVYQVATDLGHALEESGARVLAVTPQLVALAAEEDDAVQEADVLVLTPEKADLLLRIGAEALEEVAMVIIDEAHHIENDTRGILLELYLWRLKRVYAGRARYVFLSAVAPNIGDIAAWMGDNPGGDMVARRATRMRVGVYEVRLVGNRNRGVIRYTDDTEITVIDRGVDTTQLRGIPQLAHKLGASGSVLVVGRGKRTGEKLAMAMRDRLAAGEAADVLSADDLKTEPLARLDSRLEREMYAAVELRELLRFRVAYHHAGLPPRVREAVEDAISAGYIKYVFATTTLAEGVNFPFSSVIVQSLSIREAPETGRPASWRVVTPRTFWNIAGRAGRPGFDYEGQVILYAPSLGLDRVGEVLPYTEPSIAKIAPVRSALATGIQEINRLRDQGELDLADLDAVELPARVTRKAQGLVNLIRVGIAHARASGLSESASDFFEGTLAARELEGSDRAFAQQLVSQQVRVVDRYLGDQGAASERLVAELGLSIDTLSRLRSYVAQLEDWQMGSIIGSLPGGRILFEPVKYLFSAVLARMAELEGPRLSGLYADLVVEWCRGIPFSAFSSGQGGRLEELISLMYSKIQYLLPWGLYAVDRFMEEEAAERGLEYGQQVASIAYLVDVGVPNFAAMRLTHLGFERTDAARLSRAYYADREARETTDIVRWMRAQSNESLAVTVQGVDRRRIDYDFFRLVDELRRGRSTLDQ